MKKSILQFSFAFFAFLTAFCNTGLGQDSDTAPLPYNVNSIVDIIEDAIEQPTDTNAYVDVLLNEKSFPKHKMGKELTIAQREEIANWVESHVSEIQSFQWQRKVNYDKFYLNQQ